MIAARRRMATIQSLAAGGVPTRPARRRSRWAGAGVALLAVALVATSLWLPAGLPLVALADFGYDDALYVKLAGHVARGEWLGPYDESTLAKGPGFPIFVALSYRAHLPLLLASRLFAAAASGLFVLALLPLFRGRGVPLLLFAALLFNPVVVTRAARELVYPSLALVTLAGAAGLFLSLPASRGRAAAWATLCGLGLGAVWLTREEGVWLVPAVAILLVATVVRTARAEGVSRRLAEASGLAAFPALLLGASLLAVSLVNLRVYGVFTARESTDEPFLAAYGALARIRPAAPIPRVPVPREVRLRAYAQSPTLRSLEPYLEGAAGRAFVEAGETLGVDSKGDIAGGWLQFALRRSAAIRGEYRDARTAAAFWRRVAKELDGACDAGRLPCGSNPRSMLPPGALSELAVVVAQLPGTLAFLVRSVDSAPALRNPGWSRGSGAERAAFARITRERLAPAPDEPRWFVLQGWAFRRGGPPVDWRVRGVDGASVPFGVRRLPSGDVAAAFGAADALDVRVELLATCPGACVVELCGSNGPIVRFDPSRPGERLGASPPGFEMNVDSVEVASPPDKPGVWERNEARQGGLRRIAAAYRGLLVPAFPAAVALLVLGAAVSAVRRRGGPAVVVAAALLAGVVSRVALLALVERTSFPALHYLYLSPAYPLLYAFVVLAAVSAVSSLRRAPGAGYRWAKAATFGFTSRSKSA